MSDASAEVSETESVKGKDKRRSARVASAAAAKAQPAKLQPTHGVGGESTSDRPPAAAKAASKKGKKADEPRPEPAEPVQPAQPELEPPSFVYDDSTPGQIKRAFGFSERQPGARPGAFNTRPSDRPPPSYTLMEPRLPSEREQRPE